ncbi:MAG: ribulose-phosphate 3-epimerase [Chlamydiae bacterium]|nr:ribulose-phosphate 3-epimerase [Chlamydiota bacterium]
MKKKIKVAPSILSCDFAFLAQELERIEEAKADAIHIDVMDGHFVPNLTLGPKIVGAIKKHTKLFLDVHLMIYNPFEYIEKFIAAGADLITFHLEATEEVEYSLNFIKKCGKMAGLAFNPKTSFSVVPKYLNMCDLVLFMSVNPGFGGQKFIPGVLDKVELARKIIDEQKLKVEIQVDGGIDEETAKKCVEAGADFLVSGTYLFGCKDMQEGINKLKNL